MYLVTGASGNVGSNVVNQLLHDGNRVRVFTRDASRIAHWGDRVEIAVGDFGDHESFARANIGVEATFLMNGGPGGEPFRELIASIKAHGPRIVFLSTMLANDPKFVAGQLHKEKEDIIQQSGLAANFVRPVGFMSNSFQWIRSIKVDGTVYNSTGTGRSAAIAPSDIASVAVKAMSGKSPLANILELTGGELMNVPEQVDILARILRKPLRSVDISMETAVQGLIAAGIPPFMASAIAQSLEAVRDGKFQLVTNTVEEVTGQKPKSFEIWVRENETKFA